MGYEVGNAVLDSLTHHLVLEARDLYYDGLKVGNHRFRVVWRAICLRRQKHWLADGGLCPAKNFNADARW